MDFKVMNSTPSKLNTITMLLKLLLKLLISVNTLSLIKFTLNIQSESNLTIISVTASISQPLVIPNTPISIPSPDWSQSFTVPIDHFHILSPTPKTFNIKILGYSKHARPDGPIFFYAGNEGSIQGFWNNTGIMFDWAEEFGADIVFAEHRYYGSSLPFKGDSGRDSFKNIENRSYLRIEQVLADYAMFMKKYQEKNVDKNGIVTQKKVMVFGGSYGGMLAAFLRQKYPTIFHAAIAASAPIPYGFNMQGNGRTNSDFYRIVTEDAQAAHPSCPSKVQQAFTHLQAIFDRDDSSELESRVKKPFKLCKTPRKSEWSHFMQYARNAFTTLSMCDYPYPSSFLAPLPAWPVKEACRRIVNATESNPDMIKSDALINGLADAVNLPYYVKKNINNKDEPCLDMYKIFIACADQTGCGIGNDAIAWDIQMCSDMSIITTSIGGTNDMFPSRKWSQDSLDQYCIENYGIKPQPIETSVRLGAYNLEYPSWNKEHSYSQIIFSNGMLDPWHAGGYLSSLSKSLVAVKIRLGAHHLDLRSSDPENDPKSVIIARGIEKEYTKKWMFNNSYTDSKDLKLEEMSEEDFEKRISIMFMELEKANYEEDEEIKKQGVILALDYKNLNDKVSDTLKGDSNEVYIDIIILWVLLSIVIL